MAAGWQDSDLVSSVLALYASSPQGWEGQTLYVPPFWLHSVLFGWTRCCERCRCRFRACGVFCRGWAFAVAAATGALGARKNLQRSKRYND